MKASGLLISLIILGLISSCQDKAIDKAWVKPASITLDCADYAAIQSPVGVLYNNVWNKHAAKNGEWQQCIEKRVIAEVAQYGWSWQWPQKSNVIFAYPQVKLGLSPWAPEPASDNRFPLKISAINNLTISYDLDISANGQYNLATSMWLINSDTVTEKPNPSAIVAEFMIWTYSTAKHFNPAGKKVTEATIDDKKWEVWVDKNWGDASGANANKWIYITYRAKESALEARFNAFNLIQHAVANKIITADLYISDIELGNEIMSGSGIAWVKSFEVKID
jgi:hypothetical protein